TNEVLAQILKQLTVPIAVNVSPPAITMHVTQPRPLIKPGEPGNESPFQEAYDAIGGADVLGAPLGYLETINDGYVQRFDGGPSRIARVMCAPAGYPVMGMDESVWHQLEAVGGRSGGGVRCIGFPVAPASGRPYIGADWTEIPLIGGTWGRLRNDERRG